MVATAAVAGLEAGGRARRRRLRSELDRGTAGRSSYGSGWRLVVLVEVGNRRLCITTPQELWVRGWSVVYRSGETRQKRTRFKRNCVIDGQLEQHKMLKWQNWQAWKLESNQNSNRHPCTLANKPCQVETAQGCGMRQCRELKNRSTCES